MRIGIRFVRDLRKRITASGPARVVLFSSFCGLVWWVRSIWNMEGDKAIEDSNSDSSPERNSKGTSLLSGLAGANLSLQGAAFREKYSFSENSLRDFDYEFNSNGELRHIETGDEFTFKIKEDHKYNQKRYEAIGELVTEHVYQLLEEAGLQRRPVPVDAESGEAQGFVFVSEDYDKADKLLLLIHGSGVVRAGQWARSLIINHNLKSGSQLPFIERARQEGYGVVVFNTNLNKVNIDGKDKYIRGSQGAESHGVYVWQELVRPAAAKHIAVVAHSYGGIVTTAMASEHAADFEKRVFAVAFTDSVHSLAWQQAPEPIVKLYVNKAVNWVTSDEPVDTPVNKPANDAPRVSAGHVKHEWTSWSAFESIFKFFGEQLAKAVKSDL